MRSLAFKIARLTLIIGAAGVMIVLISSDHWWRRVNAAQVVYNGRNLPGADVYRSPKGELLLNLHELTDERALFVIYPAEKRIGTPNTKHFFFLPGVVFSRNVPPHVVFMDDPVKAGEDSKLEVKPHSIDFSLSGRSVQIIME